MHECVNATCTERGICTCSRDLYEYRISLRHSEMGFGKTFAVIASGHAAAIAAAYRELENAGYNDSPRFDVVEFRRLNRPY